MAEAVEGPRTVIIGAGPAGLTAAYELYKAGISAIVLEKDDVVGGIARTGNHNGYRFDIGGHRFFTKVKVVEDMWREVLGEDFLKRDRLSRIYYNKKFFYYPLRASNALFGLGLWNSSLIFLSYLRSQIFPYKSEDTLEQWISNRFGKRLYSIFFKTYTEKVWGIPCSEIRAEWAAQRIKGLSLLAALKSALLKRDSHNGAVAKTLIDSFHYPRLGPGMMWEAVADIMQRNGGGVRLRSEVEAIYWAPHRVNALRMRCNGHPDLIKGSHFISSMPIRELIEKLDPAVPEEVSKAANSLNYRDFLTVVLIINQPDVFPDNWIYIHDPDVKVGRIQNFKNWSLDMVPDPAMTCLGLEYFCFQGDLLWTMSDQELIELSKRELSALGLVCASDVVDGTIVRMPKAYPVYDSTYRESLEVINGFLSRIKNLQLVGRNGMHKYNNQDHSMLTAMLAVKNILGANYDLWQVNADPEYHEEASEGEVNGRTDLARLASTQPCVPIQTSTPTLVSDLDKVLIQTFAKLDKFAFGTAVGLVCGLAILLSTSWLIIKEGEVIGPNLQLLGQYFIGYTVTMKGAFIGMAYGFLWGFAFGWLFAGLRNLCLAAYLYGIKKRAEFLVP
jgi:protoporphyrinogen oxidase